MESQKSSKPVLSAVCFVISAIVAACLLFFGIAGLGNRNTEALATYLVVAGSIALLSASVAARSVDGR